MDVSIILPCFNDGDSVEVFASILKKTLEDNPLISCVSLLVVDDGSTPPINKSVNYDLIRFNHNYGKERAISLGLKYAKRAQYYCIMDSDGEHPPSLIIDHCQKVQSLKDLNSDRPIIINSLREPNPSEQKSKMALRNIYKKLSGLSESNGEETDCIFIDERTRNHLLTSTEKFKFLRHIPYRMLLTKYYQPVAKISFERGEAINKTRSRFSIFTLLRLGMLSILTKPKLLTALFKMGFTVYVFLLAYILAAVFFDLISGRLEPGYFTIVLLLSVNMLLLSVSAIKALTSFLSVLVEFYIDAQNFSR